MSSPSKKPLDKWKNCGIISNVPAGIAHPVERHLAKVEVASSSLVARSIEKAQCLALSFLFRFNFASGYYGFPRRSAPRNDKLSAALQNLSLRAKRGNPPPLSLPPLGGRWHGAAVTDEGYNPPCCHCEAPPGSWQSVFPKNQIKSQRSGFDLERNFNVIGRCAAPAELHMTLWH